MSQRIPRDSLIGMKNCGFTCYFNSVIQMLFDIPELRHEIFTTRVQDIKIPIQQLQLLFGQLSRPEVDTKFRIGVKSTKTVDITKMLDDLKPWMSECVLHVKKDLDQETLEVKTQILTKFPEKPGEPGTQEDAAEFLITCILNKLSERILNSISLQHTSRIEYRNKIEIVNGVPTTISRENRLNTNLKFVPILNLDILKHRDKATVNINTLIKELFHLENIDPNAKINQVEHIVSLVMPTYLFFYWNRAHTVIKDEVQRMINRGEKEKTKLNWNKNFEPIKVNTHLKLDDRIVVEDVPYKLYSVVIHEGANPNAGHYYYMFKETPETWIVFNDDSIYTMSNADFLRNKEKNVVLVNYKKEELDVRREPVNDIRRLLPSIVERAAPVEAEASAKAEASTKAEANVKGVAVVNLTKNKDHNIKESLSFLLNRLVYNNNKQYYITELIIEDGKLTGIKVQRKNYEFPTIYKLNHYTLIEDNLEPEEQIALMSYTDEKNNFIYKSKKQLKEDGAEGLTKEGGGKTRRKRIRKVDARKRKRTRKA